MKYLPKFEKSLLYLSILTPLAANSAVQAAESLGELMDLNQDACPFTAFRSSRIQ